MRLCSSLWAVNIKAEFPYERPAHLFYNSNPVSIFVCRYAENPKFQKQLTQVCCMFVFQSPKPLTFLQALECGVPLLVIIGEDELAKGEVFSLFMTGKQ